MLILGLDYETCGTPEKPPFLPTELGMVLVDYPSYRVIRTQTYVINPGVEVGQFFLDLTHLTQEQIKNGISRQAAAEGLYMMLSEAQAVLCWNGVGFDDLLAQQELSQFIGPDIPWPPWLDLKLEGNYDSRLNLTHCAADLGYLNPQSHSALGDVLTLFEVARRTNFDMDLAMQNIKYPYCEILAQVSYDTRLQASDAGYRWDVARKIWVRKIRENLIEAEAKLRPFVVRKVAADPVKDQSQSKGTQ